MALRDEIHFANPDEPRLLEARYDSAEVFAREYRQNISQGGIFIPTEASFELRDLVVVELVLAFHAERVKLDGEVVNIRPPGIAGVEAGVAVQLLESATQLRDRLGPLAEALVELDLEPAPDPMEEKRAVPRKPTRVSARVGGGDGFLRTLDLSTRGALLEAPEDPPAVGDSIEVLLQHPVTGEERTIEGTIVRHQCEGGVVRGLGVQFDTDAMEETGVERFLSDLQAAAHARSLGGIRGPIDQLGLASLLQMFGVSAPQGTLRVLRQGMEGSVAFDSGVLRHARLGELSGPKALARMLGWRDGSFEFNAQLEPGSPEDPPLSLDGAIFDAVRQNDELARALLPASVLEAPHCVDRSQLDASPEASDKVEEAVVDLVQAGFSLARLIDVIPVPDAEIHDAVRSLLERGVLRAESDS